MPPQSLIRKPIIQPTEILSQLKSGQLLRVHGPRGSALIICHRHHAELAGPGSAVGGSFDIHCRRVIPIGRISLVYPESRTERKQAYARREQWIRHTQKAMESFVPLQRARAILILLARYSGTQIVHQLPDEVIADLVGVLPKTIRMARRMLINRSEAQKLSSPLGSGSVNVAPTRLGTKLDKR